MRVSPNRGSFTSRNMEDSAAESHVDYQGPAQDGFKGKNISKWPTDSFCDILAKNGAAFCPCSKNLPGNKIKCFGYMRPRSTSFQKNQLGSFPVTSIFLKSLYVINVSHGFG